MEIKVKVTEEDVLIGEQKDSSMCPVALGVFTALEDRFPEQKIHAEVDGVNAEIQIGDHHYIGRLPMSVVAWIAGFDEGKETTPPEEFWVRFREWTQ